MERCAEHRDRYEREYEPVKEADQDAGGDALVDLIADAVRPPARNGRGRNDPRHEHHGQKRPSDHQARHSTMWWQLAGIADPSCLSVISS